MLENLFKYLPEPQFKSYLPLTFDQQQIGWVHLDHLEILQSFAHIFQIQSQQINFTRAFVNASFLERTALLDTFSRSLKDADIITNWRDEAYGIYLPGSDLANALFTIERGVAPFLGFRVFGVHINGYQIPKQQNSGIIEHIWIAKRSKLKKIEPHKLDNLAAGGLSYGEEPLESAKREAMEEANIPQNLTDKLRFSMPFNYLAEFNKTVRNECIFVFDLPLPETFIPSINDGEVENFYRLSPTEIQIALLDGEKFKPNSGLVTLHFLLRHTLTNFSPHDKKILQQKLGISQFEGSGS